MSQSVAIVFECLPFRRVSNAGLPLDASDEQRDLWRRFRAAMEKHGTENTYFLYNADCTFHLTNREGGYLRFLFEGTVRTDEQDQQPMEADLVCHLAETDFPKELAADAMNFFREAVRQAVLAEFQLFIEAGNLKQTLEREQQMLREWDENRGFMGMYI